MDAKKVEKAIKQGVERQNAGIKVASVTCPKNRKLKKGDTFTCHVIGAKPARRVVATVVQQSDKGDVRYSVR